MTTTIDDDDAYDDDDDDKLDPDDEAEAMADAETPEHRAWVAAHRTLTIDEPAAQRTRYTTAAKHGNYTVTVEAPSIEAVEQTALTALAVVIMEQTGVDISDRLDEIHVEHRVLSADDDGLIAVSAAGPAAS